MSFMSNQTEFQLDFPRKATEVVKITFTDLKSHNVTGNMTVSVS